MRHGESLPISDAVRSLGVPIEVVQSQIDHGALEATRAAGGQWQVPLSEVGQTVARQELQLDLRGDDESTQLPAQSEVLAAQAALLLAKTQASAARVQSQELFRRLRDTGNAAMADRQAREEADHALTEAEHALHDLRLDQAVAETKVEELRARLANDERHFQFMIDRIASLEHERRRLTNSLGWIGRLRYRRQVENPSPNQLSGPLVGNGPKTVPDLANGPEAGPSRRYPRPQKLPEAQRSGPHQSSPEIEQTAGPLTDSSSDPLNGPTATPSLDALAAG